MYFNSYLHNDLDHCSSIYRLHWWISKHCKHHSNNYLSVGRTQGNSRKGPRWNFQSPRTSLNASIRRYAQTAIYETSYSRITQTFSNYSSVNKLFMKIVFLSKFSTTRECTKAITIEEVEFKKGYTFIVPLYAILHDPQHFPNPYVFDPDR